MMQLISGKEIGNRLREELKTKVQQIKQQGVEPCLAVILVGNDPASEVYVRNKKKTCAELGIRSVEHNLSGDTTQDELFQIIDELNNDSSVHGILCQFPVPDQIDQDEVILKIHPDKDVDGLHPLNVGYLTIGHPRFIPCTPYGVLHLLKESECDTSGKHVVVLGRSNLVSRPISILLSHKGWDATVTICHSRTNNLVEWVSQADIVVAAIGKPEFVTADMVKEGAVVVDVGINRVDDPNSPKGSRLCGDVAFEEVSQKASLITPVPGGVGPMTITMLMQNTLYAARLQNSL